MSNKDIITITIEGTVKASAEKIWEYWNDPEYVVKWNTATPEWHTPKAKNDLRIGGKFIYRMEAKDGSVGFDFGGTYDEIKPFNLIAYTLDDDRKVKITFTEIGGSIKIVQSFDAENENPVEMQKAGWQNILNNFIKYTEEN